MSALLRRLLFCLEPEKAHGLALAALGAGLPLAPEPPRSARLETRVAGLDFPNPLGIAAGFDKDGKVPDALLRLGFGFAEIGSMTPLPQPGNPRPRIFRLPASGAVINRLGFNNGGHAACLERLEARAGRSGIVGINLGANKDSANRIVDYEMGIDTFAAHASYFTINISSPNTPGLRDLQAREQLALLLGRVTARRNAMAKRLGRQLPVFLKIASDLVETDLDDIAAEAEASPVDGLIVSNTTLSREGLQGERHAGEAGGLSGRPLFERSTRVLAKMRRRLGPKIALVGVGGVDTADTALEKIRAGADLVQLYTGFIYGGPSLPGKILTGLERYAEREGLASIGEVRDSHLDDWAAQPLV